MISSSFGQLRLQLRHPRGQLRNLTFVALDGFVVGQLFIVDLLLEFREKVLLGLVAVLQDGLHVAAAGLLQLGAQHGHFLGQALVVGCHLGQGGVDEGVLHGDGLQLGLGYQ